MNWDDLCSTVPMGDVADVSLESILAVIEGIEAQKREHARLVRRMTAREKGWQDAMLYGRFNTSCYWASQEEWDAYNAGYAAGFVDHWDTFCKPLEFPVGMVHCWRLGWHNGLPTLIDPRMFIGDVTA